MKRFLEEEKMEGEEESVLPSVGEERMEERKYLEERGGIV